MKYIIFLLLVLYLGANICLAQGNCLGGQNCGYWQPGGTITFKPADYPNCEFSIGFELRKCNGMIQVRFISASFPYIPACDSLFNELLPNGLGEAANPVLLKKLLAEGFNAGVTDIFMEAYEFAKLFGQGSQYECPALITINANFFGPCFSVCYAYKIDPVQGPDVKFAASSCDDDVCCVVEYHLCYNTSTQQIESYRQTRYDEAQDCQQQQTPDCPLQNLQQQGYTILTMPCEEACDLIIP